MSDILRLEDIVRIEAFAAQARKAFDEQDAATMRDLPRLLEPLAPEERLQKIGNLVEGLVDVAQRVSLPAQVVLAIDELALTLGLSRLREESLRGTPFWQDGYLGRPP